MIVVNSSQSENEPADIVALGFGNQPSPSEKPWLGWKILFWAPLLGLAVDVEKPFLSPHLVQPLVTSENLGKDDLSWFTIQSARWREERVGSDIHPAFLPLAIIGCYLMVRRHPVGRND